MVSKLIKSVLAELLLELEGLEEVQKFKRLEQLIFADLDLKEQVELFHNISKQMTNAKELGLENAYLEYQKEYQKLLVSFEENVILQMYLDASEDIKDILNLITEVIEKEINNKLNE